ncbi:Protein of unknown function [Pyronema omphalodes CBS 100304]|uniref:Uncharacterized protein n=1 Tax=Pyronema omphalodes (strain CBS 100304) TaxID=1076935 RepID=U4LDR7_PYROM|nr:Protein of unknown function [Pyronema omphalodes CBS 100304]
MWNVPIPVINVTYKYLLIPLNAALVVWVVWMNYAWIHPTSDNSLPLRGKGLWHYNIYYMCLCIACVVIGFLNVFIVYKAFSQVPRRWKKYKNASTWSCCRATPIYKVYAGLIMVLVFSYGLIAAVAFRDVFAELAYNTECDGYRLMADIEIRDEFPAWTGAPGSPVYDASSTIRFFKDGRYQYTMDLVRGFNQSLGFDNLDEYNRPMSRNQWGNFELALRMPGIAVKGGPPQKGEYFNTTKMLDDQSRGVNYTVPGPIASIQYKVWNSSYAVTFTNNTAPGFRAETRLGGFSSGNTGLKFPELDLEQGNKGPWRYTDNVCLPPRLFMRGRNRMEYAIFGELERGCRRYKMCAVQKDKKASTDKQAFSQFIESIWQVTVGLVAWEYESYSKCCRRRE